MESRIDPNNSDPTLTIDGAIEKSYFYTCESKLLGYTRYGNESSITLGSHNIPLDEIVKIASQTVPAGEFLGIEGGAGLGAAVEYLNEQFKNLGQFKGITAEHVDFKNPGENIILGNLEKLPVLLGSMKPHLFFSRFTTNFLVHPLGFLQNVYASLPEGGYFFIDHVDVHGLKGYEGDAVIKWLIAQGYEIAAGRSLQQSKCETHDMWGTRWIFIRKNHKEKLEFPLILSQVKRFTNDISHSISIKTRYIVHRPNKVLLDFANSGAGEKIDIDRKSNEQLQTWGFQLPKSEVSNSFHEQKANPIITTSTASLFTVPKSQTNNGSENQYLNLNSLIKTLQSEISSCWPYPNKDRKRKKVIYLERIKNHYDVNQLSLKASADAIKSLYASEYKTAILGCSSTRTRDLLTLLSTESTVNEKSALLQKNNG